MTLLYLLYQRKLLIHSQISTLKIRVYLSYTFNGSTTLIFLICTVEVYKSTNMRGFNPFRVILHFTEGNKSGTEGN